MESLKTPCFILDKEKLEKNVSDMTEALSHYFSHWIIGYSFKTNSLLYVVDYMKHRHCYAEVVSYREYELAKHLGYEHIIYNGPMKSSETFYEALTDGHIVNIETHRELDWLKQYDKSAKIGVRVNFDLEQYCPNESACGSEGGRFGFCYENGVFENILKTIQDMPHVTLEGLHLHVSTKTRSLNIYRAIANIAKKLIEQYALDLSYIDIGGGFFGGMPNKPSFNDYFKEVYDVLGDQYTIIVEPGASLIASPFSYMASVIDVKDTSYNRFVVLDGTRNDLDPQFKKSNYIIDLVTKNEQVIKTQVISGYTCMEHDRLLTLSNQRELSVNDKILFDKVGSYTMCLSPNFIKYFPTVYVKNGEQYKEIRREWGVNEYISGASYYGE